MDTLQGSTDASDKKEADAGWQHTPSESEAKHAEKSELKMPIDVSSIKMPSFKMPEGGIMNLIKRKLGEYKRVYSITKKPDRTEFTATVKASGLGILVIGVLGFIITMIVQLIQMVK